MADQVAIVKKMNRHCKSVSYTLTNESARKRMHRNKRKFASSKGPLVLFLLFFGVLKCGSENDAPSNDIGMGPMDSAIDSDPSILDISPDIKKGLSVPCERDDDCGDTMACGSED